MTNQKVGAEDSVSNQQENRGKLESKKKLKKVRSIRLQRLSSMRSITRGGKPQHDNLSIFSSESTESSGKQTPIEMVDASPSYMKATTSRTHAKDGFQSTQNTHTKKTFTRTSTLKLKRSLTRKLSGRTEPNRKLKSSRSIKIATSKAPKSTRKQSESLNGSDAGDRSQRVITRRLSLKPVRFLTKVPSFKSKNSSMEKGPQKSKSLAGSRLIKATCSSTLKDSHFTDHIDLPQEGTDSQGASAMKVCSFTYCSLHGHHHHDDSPPLKQFVSMRRRMLKAQKSMKMDGRSKQFGNARKATQKTKNVHSEDGRSEQFGNARKAIQKTIPVHSEDGRSKQFVNARKAIQKTKTVHSGDGRSKQFGNDESATMESNTKDAVKLSAADIEISDGGVTTEGKNMEPDYEALQMTSVEEEPKTASATDAAANGMQERDHKNMKMWHLMFKHAVLSNKSENKVPVNGKDKEEREQDALAFDGEDNSSCHSSCEADQDMGDDNKNVIELVQKAFDEILLPEAEGFSSDDSFKSGGTGSDEVLQEKSEGTGEERNTLTSTESPKEEQKMGTKPDQRTPKSWSNLRKLILLKRFVKAMEKVRNMNFRRPRQFPSDASLEAEKVFLKNQTAEERRKAEEWMLDYALQKVISKLAPAQRQRVTLLIEAFEAVLPFQDGENGQQSSATVEPQAHPIQSLDDFSGQSKEETDEGRDHDYSTHILLGKESCSINSIMEFSDNGSDNTVHELQNSIVLKERCFDSLGTNEEDLNGKQALATTFDDGEKISIDNDNIYGEIEDSGSHSLCKPDEIISTSHEEAPTNETVNEVPEDLISNLDTENSNIKSESSGRDFETKNEIGDNGEQLSVSKSFILNGLVRSLRSNLVGSGSSSNLLDEPPHSQSEAPRSTVAEPETRQEKQGYTGLWYMVYKHMVSDMDENNSSSVIDEKESGNESSGTRGTSASYENTPLTNQDTNNKDQAVADPDVELQQIEAIKMVEEAIDSILPDAEDQLPDRQPLTERMCSEGLNQKEETIESSKEKVESAQKEGNKPNQPLNRSWSNLKKVILLRRFIKALEKVRKFNPRGPRFLPIEPDPEAEKVQLRHQDMDARKGTEEWMLDYALRQVVSKLTPARKRKVELLVEAFETVTPSIKS